jgi:hypothetical protein
MKKDKKEKEVIKKRNRPSIGYHAILLAVTTKTKLVAG